MPNFNYLYENVDNKMRNLRLYKNDADFKSYEHEAGGTGVDVESVVPGIVKTLDERNMYFNPHDKEIQFHTLTINYKKRYGDSLAPSTTKSIKYIPSVEQEIVVTPENIEGYTPVESKKAVSIPTDSVVDFIYSPVLDPSKPLTFKIISGGTINWINSITYVGRTISYSKDGGETWTNITSTTGTGKVINVIAGDIVMFKGDNNTYATTTSKYDKFGSVSAKFEVEGNIMSLINSNNFQTTTTLPSSYTFFRLFYNCTGLTSAEKLVLPATTLAENCYNGMFYGCTSLTTAPELPATTLASYCYHSMFQGCTNLTTAPELPATTLADYCYYQMFSNCTSLTTAPELPATTLADGCYFDMFSYTNILPDCTNIDFASPAVIQSGGLKGLFYGTKVTDNDLFNILPVNSQNGKYYLPATTLANGCYSYMFQRCTSLTMAPELPATTLASYCYQYMFYDCTKLTTAPELPATTLTNYCYEGMFQNCISLTTAPELPATTLAIYCYYRMFYGCTKLTTAPELPATTLANGCYCDMFQDCASLVTAPSLPATTLADNCYEGMFRSCTHLTTAPTLPATKLAFSCYNAMFNNCTSLTTAPVLPVATLESYCYCNMFTSCISLNYIKCLATNISASNCIYNWVNGVASTGTFVKNASMSSWTTGDSGIPTNWTVQDAS